ncbi:MAG: hypothetical protein K8R48_03030 [Alphaproteobacteria bacterium]|nr:hypothetical protein [Alphaproteobacteria bacterium]
MNDFSPKSNFLSRDAGERLIRVWVPDEDGTTFLPFSFSIAAVEGVMGAGEKRSTLILRSGMKIAVALPHEDLEKKIYTPDFREPVLDLRNVTGSAVISLHLNMRALLRRENTNSVVVHDFPEVNIASAEHYETGRSKSGKSIKIKFNAAAQRPPFAGTNNEALLDMPLEDFKSFCAKAKNSGLSSLDLCQVFKDNPQKYGLNPK